VRAILKRIGYVVASVLVAPLVLSEHLARTIFRRPAVFFRTHTELLSLVPGKLGIHVRGSYYHWLLPRCPWGSGFQFGTIINAEAEIGKSVCTGAYVLIGRAIIGDDCILSEGVHVVSGKFSHGVNDPEIPFREQTPVPSPLISVGRNCWIGANAVILADLGENCIVSAGAVVTRPFPANKILVGNPARPVVDTFDPKLAEGRAAAMPGNLPT
jgi:virginiamycin A acetyltransferase